MSYHLSSCPYHVEIDEDGAKRLVFNFKNHGIAMEIGMIDGYLEFEFPELPRERITTIVTGSTVEYCERTSVIDVSDRAVELFKISCETNRPLGEIVVRMVKDNELTPEELDALSFGAFQWKHVAECAVHLGCDHWLYKRAREKQDGRALSYLAQTD